MSSVADTLLADVDPLHAELFGVSVDYLRGVTTIVGVTARVGIQEYEVTGRSGSITFVKVREYVIAKADVTIDSAEIEPRSGDRIRETINGVVRNFDVSPMANKLVAEDDDTGGSDWRIRTKETAI